MSMKIGVINSVIEEQGPDALRTAGELGFDGVEYFVPAPWQSKEWFCPDFQKEIRETSEQTGVAVPSLCLAYMNQTPLCSPDPVARWAVLESIFSYVEVAKSVGATEILMAFYGNGELAFRRDLGCVVEQLKAAAPVAEAAGIGLGIESTLSSKQYIDILDRVGSPAVNIYLDMCNPYVWHHDTEEQIRSLGDRIGQIHFKEGSGDRLGGEDLGEGFNNWDEICAALKEINYNGWAVLETSSNSGDAKADAKMNLERARGLAARCQ
jgi:sugar phosphate isomerase/epimerase